MSSDATSSVTSMREARRAAPDAPRRAESGPPLTTFIASWQLALEAANKSPQTVRAYTDSVRSLCKFLVDHDMPADVEGVDAAAHPRLTCCARSSGRRPCPRRTTSGTSACSSAGSPREGERENPNPMDRVEAPKVTKKAKAFFTDDELAQLLKTCSGRTFADRRDTAIMRIFIDTGIRVSGLAGLRYDPDDEYRERRLPERSAGSASASRAETRPGYRSARRPPRP